MNKKMRLLNDFKLYLQDKSNIAFCTKFYTEEYKLFTTDDVANAIEKIQQQLEEKDKIINEILDFAFCNYCPYQCFFDEEQEECDKVKELCNCEKCEKTFKECWLKYFENKTLERGKNGK